MRASLPLTLLLSALLAACSTKGDIPPSKHIAQSGALRVHPGLLGKPVPAELQSEARAASTPAARMHPIITMIKLKPLFSSNTPAPKA